MYQIKLVAYVQLDENGTAAKPFLLQNIILYNSFK